MRRTVVAYFLWLITTCGGAFGQFHHVTTLDTLVFRLDSLADTATIEHYRCLLGWRRGDTLIVYAAWEPPIQHADYDGIQPAIPCPDGTVGEWHNHLAYDVPMNDPHNRSTPVDPWSMCDLSPVDRRSALDRDSPPYQLLSVKTGVHCSWLRTDDSTLRRLPWRIAP